MGGGALGVSALLCEAGGVCPRAGLAKTAKTKAVPIRIILAPIFSKRTLPRAASLSPSSTSAPRFDRTPARGVPCRLSGAGRGPFRRTSHGQPGLPVRYYLLFDPRLGRGRR